MNKKLYRVSDEAMVGGVCAGIAQFTGISVNIVRVIAVLLLFMGFFVVTTLVYFLFVLIVDDMPAHAINNESKKPFKTRVTELNRKFTENQRRVNSLEKYITSNRYDIDKKFKELG